jgi:hypothetical protein
MRATSAESATPKHMPEASSCRTSTLWKSWNRGCWVTWKRGSDPMKTGTKMDDRSCRLVRMVGLCGWGLAAVQRFLERRDSHSPRRSCDEWGRLFDLGYFAGGTALG